jgi:hypothetical protein
MTEVDAHLSLFSTNVRHLNHIQTTSITFEHQWQNEVIKAGAVLISQVTVIAKSK